MKTRRTPIPTYQELEKILGSGVLSRGTLTFLPEMIGQPQRGFLADVGTEVQPSLQESLHCVQVIRGQHGEVDTLGELIFRIEEDVVLFGFTVMDDDGSRDVVA